MAQDGLYVYHLIPLETHEDKTTLLPLRGQPATSVSQPTDVVETRHKTAPFVDEVDAAGREQTGERH